MHPHPEVLREMVRQHQEYLIELGRPRPMHPLTRIARHALGHLLIRMGQMPRDPAPVPGPEPATTLC